LNTSSQRAGFDPCARKSGLLGPGLRSIAEPWADTTSPAGKMILTVFGGIAEFERSLIRERTGAGRKAAMTRGVKFGRPPKLSAEQIALIARLADEGQTAPQIAQTFGVHEQRSIGAWGGPEPLPSNPVPLLLEPLLQAVACLVLFNPGHWCGPLVLAVYDGPS
jgi:Resolvase, N terminal domain/Helix-turn-helix domain of resolvase